METLSNVGKINPEVYFAKYKGKKRHNICYISYKWPLFEYITP